jgi:drug/metabolite transporter (DMT)-like permease
MGGREWVLLLALAFLWSGSFLFFAVALADMAPLTVVLGRVGLAAPALLLILAATGQRLPSDWRQWRLFLVMGALNNAIPFSLIAWGQLHIDSGLAAIFNATTPLFTVTLAHFLTGDERLTANRLVGLGCGLAGVVLLVGPQAFAGLGVAGWSELAVLAAGCSYAGASLFGRRFRGTPPLVAAAGMLCGATVLQLPLVLAIDRPWQLPAPGLGALAAVLAVALLCTALAYVLYFHILATAGATNLMLVTLIAPVGALALGAIFRGERATGLTLAGLALILGGLAAIDGRLFRRWRAALARRFITS